MKELKTIEQQSDLYKQYIDEHIKNVEKAYLAFKKNGNCIALIQKYNGTIMDILRTVSNNIHIHDQTKYDEEEFDPYRRYFYPIDDKEKEDAKEDFDRAWRHHYMSNPHHPEHWAIGKDVRKMPLHYIIEMICDWQAMSYKFNNKISKWYEENKKDIPLHSETRKIVEEFIKAFES